MPDPPPIPRTAAPFGALGVLLGFALLCLVALGIGLLCEGGSGGRESSAPPEARSPMAHHAAEAPTRDADSARALTMKGGGDAAGPLGGAGAVDAAERVDGDGGVGAARRVDGDGEGDRRGGADGRTDANRRGAVERATAPLRPGALALVLTVALGVAWALRRVPGGAAVGPPPGASDRAGAAGDGRAPRPGPWPRGDAPAGAWLTTAELPPLPDGFAVPDAPPRGVVDVRTAMSGSSWAGGTGRTGCEGELEPHPAVHVLHDRLVPASGTRIDHVLIGPAGVVVAATKDYPGRVRTDGIRLRVRGRNRSGEVDVCLWHAETVREVLEREGLGAVPVHAVLHWLRPSGLGAQRIELRGVRLLSSGETVEAAWAADLLETDVARRVAELLRVAFPVAGTTGA